MTPSNQQLKPGNNLSEDDPNTGSEMTFGLSSKYKDWAPILTWANSHGVIDAVSLIADAAYLASFTPSNIIHFLDFIRQSETRRLLEKWRLLDPIADLLAQLASVVEQNDDIYQLMDQPSKSQAKEQIRGSTGILYLLGMIIADSPTGYSPGELKDFRALKLWVLIQLLKQASDDIYQEPYMMDLANRIRQCENSAHEFPSETIKGILPGTDDYELFPYQLGQKAQKRLTRLQRDNEKQSAATHFLRHVKKLANGETGRKGQGPSGKGQQSWFDRFGGDLSNFQPQVRPPVLPDIAKDEAQSLKLPLDEDDDMLVIDLEDIKDSLAERELRKQDFLAHDVEYQQYLPWSWHNPNAIEIKALDTWINTTLRSIQFSHRLLAAMTWVARSCGRSLKHVMEMTMATQPHNEWAWDQECACLHRVPPRRSNGWEPNDQQTPWVTTTAERIWLPLPEAVQNVLIEAALNQKDATTLGDLWRISDGHPSQLFRKLSKGSNLSRIQPGMLANILPLKCYMATGNGTQTRLFAAHSIQGLPGACAYPSFLGSDLHGFFSTTNDSDISLGSRLDPVDTLLRQAISNAARRLDQIKSGDDLIQHHNHLIAYLREAVLAASGMRPLRDQIESSRQIDEQQHFIYVDDKGSDAARQGRLVPLPEHLAHFLCHDYPRHLKCLVRMLDEVAPQMAHEIQLLSEGRPSKKLPYFFLLTAQDGKLGWQSASTKNLSALDLFDWPLPDNLFRHRLVDQLLRRGVSQEIIDGALGHLAHNTASYGPYSPRSWKEDRQVLQPVLEAAFADLQFRLPKIGRKLPSLDTDIVFEKPLASDQFGQSSRIRERRRIKQRAFLEANALIDRLAQGRDLTALEESELQELAQKLCLNPDGTPHPAGLHRYDHFHRRLHAAWLKKGKRVRSGRRLYSGGYREKSLFLPEAVNAQQLYGQLKRLLPDLIQKVLQASRSRNKDSALLAALSLCLENRISNTKLLDGVIGKKDIRLVIYKQRAELEFAPDLSITLTCGAVQRIPISARTAELLDAALGQKQPYNLENKVPTYLKSLIKPMQASGHLCNHPTVRAFIRALANLVDQYNVQTLPAVGAAVLSGTVATYSLTWADRLRLQTGRPVKICYEEEEDIAQPFDKKALPIYGVTISGYLEDATYEANAKAFIDTLRSQIPPATEQSQWSSKEKRLQLARQMMKSMQPQVTQVSSAMLLLGKWTAYLVRQKAYGKRSFLSFNTVRRYLTALSVPFSQLGYAFDLANADQEAVTEFYRDILQIGKKATRIYRAKRIPDFHRWARTEGLEDPIWAELPEFPAIQKVAPGLMSEPEYLQIFHYLQSQRDVAHQLTDIQAFVWLCVYRYGLRDHEVFYLRNSDWFRDDQDKIILFVRHNKRRRLKTDTSRRQVPCLYELTDPEMELLERMLSSNKKHYDWETAPYVVEERWQQERWRVRSGILATIKAVTGNPDANIHHGRHAAGNQVGVALYEPKLPAYWQTFLQDAQWQQQTRVTLLGRPEHSRRSSWAGCRYLGHSRPKTSLENYWHFLLDWIGELIPIDNKLPAQTQWQHAIYLENHIQRLQPEPPPEIDYAYRPATPLRFMDLFQYLANGLTPERAAQILRINPSLSTQVNHLLESLGRKMLRGIHAKYGEDTAWSEPSVPHAGFLQHITIGGWRRLATLCESHPKKSLDTHIETDELDRMVGAGRHLLMWKPEHFLLVSHFLDHYEMPKTLYQAVIRTGSSRDVREMAKKAGFTIKSQKAAAGAKGKTPLQIDTVRLGASRVTQDEDRCAIVTVKNSQLPVHNGYELAALFVAWALGETDTV